MDVELLKSAGDWGVTGILLLVTLLSFRERSEERKSRDEREVARVAASLEQTARLAELTSAIDHLVDRLPQICRSSGAAAGRGA